MWRRSPGPDGLPSRGLWARRTGARTGGGSSQAQAEGAARPRSRPLPGLGRKRGARRGGAAAPSKAQGSRPPAAPVGAGVDLRRPLRPPGKDGPWSVSAPYPRVMGLRPEPTRVRPAVRLSLAHTKPPPAAQATAPTLAATRVCHLQDSKPPTPASRQALTSRMGPCFSSRTIRTPPLPAIFLGGHLQRFRGDFLSVGTKLVTPLTKNTRENHKQSIQRGATIIEKST